MVLLMAASVNVIDTDMGDRLARSPLFVAVGEEDFVDMVPSTTPRPCVLGSSCAHLVVVNRLLLGERAKGEPNPALTGPRHSCAELCAASALLAALTPPTPPGSGLCLDEQRRAAGPGVAWGCRRAGPGRGRQEARGLPALSPSNGYQGEAAPRGFEAAGQSTAAVL